MKSKGGAIMDWQRRGIEGRSWMLLSKMRGREAREGVLLAVGLEKKRCRGGAQDILFQNKAVTRPTVAKSREFC